MESVQKVSNFKSKLYSPKELSVSKVQAYASFIKIEHTILSLPLIFAGTVIHLRGWPSFSLAVLILTAAIGARVVAMGLNRIIDSKIDAKNPRTRVRELPRGAINLVEAWAIVILAGALYLWSAWAINPICFKFSPIPVILFVIYPYLKRFTPFAHIGLGLAWSMAPLGGWLAASGSVAQFGEIVWLWLFSFMWVAGFDVIYATMDEEFDKRAGLHSLVVLLGKAKALKISGLLHVVAFGALAILGHFQFRSLISFVMLLAVGALFVWQYLIADKKPAFAFFQINGWVGFVVLALIISGI